MREKIEKLINEEIQYQLDEIDFESYFDEKKIKKMVDKEIGDLILRRIAEKVEMSIIQGIQKKYPILDSFIVNKINNILNEIEKL